MKAFIKILILSLTMVIAAVLFPKQLKAQQENVNFQIFYDELSPYGQWVDYPNYGYVWIPDVGNDFEPYSTDGHWVMTDYGWTWISDYDWGWAPFHYGRWNYDNFYGWFWVPDNEWGPAWVTWRSADGYYGWSPMESGLSLSLSFGRPYNRQNDHWTFVRNGDIDRPDISHYYTNQTDRNRIIINSKVINQTYVDNKRNVTYVFGPSREDVQRVTGRSFKSVSVQENDRPGQTMINGQLRIFRPQINKNNNQGTRPTPYRISNLKDVQRPSDRIQNNQTRNISPTDNNMQSRRQDNVNPRINNQQPITPQNTNQTVPDRSQQQQRTVNQQENNPRPVVPRNITPSLPDNRQQPQRTVSPQNNVDPKSVVPQNVNPTTNDRRQQPQNNVNPQNTNAKPAPVQNVTPLNREQQKAIRSSSRKVQQPDKQKIEEEKKKP